MQVQEASMMDHDIKDMCQSQQLIERLTLLEERKDELLVKITFLRELLENEEEALKLVRVEEDKIAKIITNSAQVDSIFAA